MTPRRYTVEPYPPGAWIVIDTHANTQVTSHISIYDRKADAQTLADHLEQAARQRAAEETTG